MGVTIREENGAAITIIEVEAEQATWQTQKAIATLIIILAHNDGQDAKTIVEQIRDARIKSYHTIKVLEAWAFLLQARFRLASEGDKYQKWYIEIIDDEGMAERVYW